MIYRVNNNLQYSSQMTQEVVNNDTMRVSKETISLADFVRNVMKNNGLTAREVERRSRKGVTHSYVNKLKNGTAENPSPGILKALAKGLGVTEEEIFAIARGSILETDEQIISIISELSEFRKNDLLEIAKLYLYEKRRNDVDITENNVLPFLNQKNEIQDYTNGSTNFKDDENKIVNISSDPSDNEVDPFLDEYIEKHIKPKINK